MLLLLHSDANRPLSRLGSDRAGQNEPSNGRHAQAINNALMAAGCSTARLQQLSPWHLLAVPRAVYTGCAAPLINLINI